MTGVTHRSGYRIAAPLLAVLCSLVVAAQASAVPTKLCATNEETCSAENTWGFAGENYFQGVVESASLVQTGFLTVSCNAGKLGSNLAEGSGPLTGELWKWNFVGCTPEGCTLATAKTEGTGYSAELEATGGGNGTMRIGNTPTLVLTCSTPSLTCRYKTASMELSVTGGNSPGAVITTSTKLMKDFFSSFICSATATYEAEYWINAPGPPVYATN
jgi:hypothetical protein